MIAAGDQPISVKEAIAACGLFGIKENSVRVALTRLSSGLLIQAVGRGLYQIGPTAKGVVAGIDEWRDAHLRLTDWDGAWVGVYCADLGRSDRSVLKRRERALELNGFRAFQKSLYVRPNNLKGGVEQMRERLYMMGLASTAPVFLMHQLSATETQAVRGLWDANALETAYQSTQHSLTEWLQRCDALEVEEAARESFVMGDAAIRQWIYDPLLPAELVDIAARSAFVATLHDYDRKGREIWHALYQQSRATPQAKPR